MNEVFGGMRLVLFASGMFPCVCVPATCVKQWWVLSISPWQECLRLTQVLLEQLAQAEALVFERRIVSFRREWLTQASSRRKTLCALLCSHPRPGEGFYFWANGDLAQASWSRPSEG